MLIDSTASGRCTTWMLSLVWGKRALPLCWRVLKQKKGHAPQQLPCDLLAEVRDLLPNDVPIVLLGDGEFDTCLLQATISEYGWFYVLRTAKDLTVEADGAAFCFDTPLLLCRAKRPSGLNRLLLPKNDFSMASMRLSGMTGGTKTHSSY